MFLSDFDYELPPALIADYPAKPRSSSRLLDLSAGRNSTVDRNMRDFPALINANDLLVFNDTKVIPARMYGCKESGGKVEMLVERLLDENRVLAHIRASKSPKPGTKILLGEVLIPVQVAARTDDLFELEFPCETPVLEFLEQHGHVPLPPYIQREDQQSDRSDYQTIYAQNPGAVAAPTAGLHFDDEIWSALKKRGVPMQFVTLHVGAGTFQPVRVERLEDHVMHAETIHISADVCAAVKDTQQRGGRVIAVGTTVVRSLETAAQQGRLQSYSGESRLFITPGYRFQVVDALLTNFHLPKSTLLMMVCAFAGYEPVMEAYRYAIEQQYRFFSYGDAMFLSSQA